MVRGKYFPRSLWAIKPEYVAQCQKKERYWLIKSGKWKLTLKVDLLFLHARFGILSPRNTCTHTRWMFKTWFILYFLVSLLRELKSSFSSHIALFLFFLCWCHEWKESSSFLCLEYKEEEHWQNLKYEEEIKATTRNVFLKGRSYIREFNNIAYLRLFLQHVGPQ